MNRGNLFSSVEIRYPSREIRREQSGPSPQAENMESERQKTGAKVAHLAIGTRIALLLFAIGRQCQSMPAQQ
jgi:hypothetical protein